MPNTEMSNRVRRQMLVGRVSKMYNAGYSVKEIQTELNLTESQVRPLIEICEGANKVRSQIDISTTNVAE